MSPVSEKSGIQEAGRLQVTIRGAVQGVGFRPFIYRLARELGLRGWVSNSSQGVLVEIEGRPERLQEFLSRLRLESPPRAFIRSLEALSLAAAGDTDFKIRPSAGGEKSVLLPPDLAACAECLEDIYNPQNRRYRYPFTTCTHCGPRFSMMEALPYDRARTTMKSFDLCPACRAEYEDPADRRFHAQAIACPQCGPGLELWNEEGEVLSAGDEALREAAEAVRRGKIVAVKGLGGFHLMAAARCEEAIKALRRAKSREEKPFALMYPDLSFIRSQCRISQAEKRLLDSVECPIVLLRRKPGLGEIAPSVAPGNPHLGVMLPYTPLHHLLLKDLGFPVVATSGNRSDEAICTDGREALRRLKNIAEVFLVHNRPIARPVDDSVVQVVLGEEQVLRRARGYAPLPLGLKQSPPAVLAVGGHLKNTVALSVGGEALVSQHIGDLETPETRQAFRRTVEDLSNFYEFSPQAVCCDAHPDYHSTRYAQGLGIPIMKVQHHHAHVLSCAAEHGLEGEVLGVAWDGSGYGTDATLWGGEFLRVGGGSFERLAHFRTFPLPGGETAVREPRRAGLGLLFELMGGQAFEQENLAPLKAFPPKTLKVLRAMLLKNLNTVRTSSVGRLFDAVSSIAGLRQACSFEGQAAMELEFSLKPGHEKALYEFGLPENDGSSPIVIDWGPMMREILRDADRRVAAGEIATKFHHTLAAIILAVAGRAGLKQVVLSGGCFQNRHLTEQTVLALKRAGYSPYWQRRIPPNDGGIALGQLAAAGLKQL